MTQIRSAMLGLMLTMFCISIAAAGADRGREKAVVAKVIRDNIGWAMTKDRPLLESTMARDGRLLIINPSSEITRGWEPFAKNFDFWMDPRFKATGLDIRDLQIDFSPLGDAAWWSCILDDLYEWDGKPGAWKDTRWTGVLEKCEGKWRIVQMHFSFASDKVVAEARARMQTQGADALKAALDYSEGWYDGDAARVEKVLHPQFVRRIAAVTVAGDDFFWHQDRARFLAAVRAGGDKATPADQRQIKAAVRDLARTTATVRVDSAYYVEYVSLVKLRSQWQIVNVLWENVPNDQKEIELDAKALADYPGIYRNEKGMEWRVFIEGKRLFLQQGDDPKIEFFPASETDFFTKGYKSSITFARDAAGRVTRFVKRLNCRDFTFSREK